MAEVRSSLQGVVVSVGVAPGDPVTAASEVAVIESMKMEYPLEAGSAGVVADILVAEGDNVSPGQLVAVIELVDADSAVPGSPSSGPPAVPGSGAGAADPAVTAHAASVSAAAAALGPAVGAPGDAAAGRGADGPTPVGGAASPPGVRADLAEVIERHAFGLDANRPDAVRRRRERGQRTARENIEDLCDPGSFVEYGALTVAAQRRRRSVDDLVERTPADGMVAGIGTVGGRPTAVLSYDYTVLAGTQGWYNHRKKDRLFELIERQRLPVVFFTEGGGGRPGDTDVPMISGLDTMAFHLWGRLSGLVPRVGITTGRCFAGNAAILGSCDVVIATEGSNIGMGGPAMVEGGGLGVFEPEEIGPMDVQVANGVVDIAVADEAEAVAVAKRYLSYFADTSTSSDGGPDRDRTGEGAAGTWACAEQALLRDVIPENRLRVYDVRAVVDLLADSGSVLELRPGFGLGMVTALARIEGRPVGILANNPMHLAGAIDADGSDKAARFLQLCDAFDLPVVSLCDTPGFMVGPDAERTGLVRHVSRLFVTAASLSVPFVTIVVRKGYGLGAQAMAAGSFHAPLFCVAWPTGELGGMGLEGAVRLGFRKELEAIADPAEREQRFSEMVAASYEHGKALNVASHFELDGVIDPADSRRWIATALRSAPAPAPRDGKKRPMVDTW